MKKLLVMRHAKSSWDDASLTDFERPLNQRGLKAAALMGRQIRDRNCLPDLIISSSARRAKETAELVKKAGEFSADVRFEGEIYLASYPTLLKILSQTASEFKEVLLIGHNPGFEHLIEVLTGQTEPMPTAAVAVISLEIESWDEISAGCGTLEILLRPKELLKF